MNIPIILGTARIGRQSEKVAGFMLAETRKYGLDSEIIDVRDFRIEATDNTGQGNQAVRLAEKVSRADGLIIVSPEYNRGYPGELKMMLDMLYKQYARKPVAICGVSSGPFGGARMIQQLKLICLGLHMVTLDDAIYFSNVEDLFDASGAIMNPSYYKQAKHLLDELVWHAGALKKG